MCGVIKGLQSAVVDHTSYTDSFTYDENSNTLAPGASAGVTCRVEAGVTYKQSYNAENRISAINKMSGSCATGTSTESWLYAYDGDGTRVSTAHFTGANPNPDSFTRYYFGGALETTGGAVKKYYSFAGQTVAMKENGVFKYFLSDHLGSTSVVLSAAGAILEQQRYLPFGTPRYANITSTDFTYTGQRALPNTGLMDYKARFYSPSLGRFIQPDTIIPVMVNPQSWNRYSYVINNPIKLNDPSGHKCAGDDAGCMPGEGGTGPKKPGYRNVNYCKTHRSACGSEPKPKEEQGAPTKLDLLFDPYYGPFIEDLESNSVTREQLENLDAIWLSADIAYDAYGFDLDEIAAKGQLNPLSANQIYEFLEVGGPIESPLMDRTAHRPYVLFLEIVGMKMNPGNSSYLVRDPMQFEPNYMAAMMVEHQDALEAAKLVYEEEHPIVDRMNNSSGDLIQYFVENIRRRPIVTAP